MTQDHGVLVTSCTDDIGSDKMRFDTLLETINLYHRGGATLQEVAQALADSLSAAVKELWK